MSDESVDLGGSAERAELRALLRSAVGGLNAGEKDLIELQLRQGLEVAEVAAVLEVSRNHAHALASRARDQLQTSLGALLVARTGREDCAALNILLADWDGQLNVLMRKRINRHIENCAACADRRRRELAPALLLDLAPLAALPIAAMPAGLRAQVLRLASGNTPEALAHRADVAQRTTIGSQGFPKPVDGPKPRWRTWRTWRAQSAAPSASTTPASTPSSAPPPPGPGTLSVTPTSILLSPVTGGSLTLTASGGPVRWSVTEPSSLIGRLTIAPSAGTLASGQSVTVSLSVSGLASVDSSLTVSPGGMTVTVLLGLGVG